jgi:Ion transport protein
VRLLEADALFDNFDDDDGHVNGEYTPDADNSAMEKRDDHDDDDYVLSHERVVRAALLVDDANKDWKFKYRTNSLALRVYRWRGHWLTMLLLNVAVVTLLSLTFFEQPRMIDGVPDALLCGIELLCMAVFAGELCLRYVFLRQGEMLRDKKHWMQVVVLALCYIDMVIWIALGGKMVRWSRVLRPLFVVYHVKPIRVILRDVRRTLPAIAEVATLLFGSVLLFAVLGMVLFHDTEEGDRYFDDLVDAFTNCFVLATNANFPGVMMPSYNSSGWYTLFFVAYLLLTMFLLLNLLLAVVFVRYKRYMFSEVRKAVAKQTPMLAAAFDWLDERGTGAISRHVWRQLFAVLRPRYSRAKVDLLFRILDEDNGGTISRAEFAQSIDLFSVHLRDRHYARVTVGRYCPRFFDSAPSRLLRTLALSRYLSLLVNAIVLVDVVLIVVYMDDMLNDPSFTLRVAFDWIVWSALFVECVLKMYALGVRAFVAGHWHRFDMVLLATMSVLLVLERVVDVPSRLVRAVAVLRLFRLVELVQHLPRFMIILKTIWLLVPSLLYFTATLLCVFYSFAIVGMELFAGLIYRGNRDLIATGYAKEDFFANSFNDFGAALVLLFELLVGNDWHVLTGGFVAVTSRWAWIFFIAFNFLVATVILDIVVAFVVEVYVEVYSILSNAKSKRHFVKADRVERRLMQLRRDGHIAPLAADGHIERRSEAKELQSVLSGRGADDEGDGFISGRWDARSKRGLNYMLRLIFQSELDLDSEVRQNLDALERTNNSNDDDDDGDDDNDDDDDDSMLDDQDIIG